MDAKAPHQIVIRNRAVAINPIDWIVKQLGTEFVFQWLKYSMVMGFDVAGEVVEVGPDVTRFKIGDRVLGLTSGHEEQINTCAEAALPVVYGAAGAHDGADHGGTVIRGGLCGAVGDVDSCMWAVSEGSAGFGAAVTQP